MEIGMFASGEEDKYNKDFKKLVSVVDVSPVNIGILVHFEIFPRNQVSKVFKKIKEDNSEDYKIDIKSFKYGSRDVIWRLSVEQKDV